MNEYKVLQEVTNHFVDIVPVVEGLNIINLYANDDSVTGPEQPIYVLVCVQHEKFELLSK